MEKAKTDRHDEARAGRCSRGFLRVLKDFSALGVNSALSDIGMYSAPIRPSGFLGLHRNLKLCTSMAK